MAGLHSRRRRRAGRSMRAATAERTRCSWWMAHGRGTQHVNWRSPRAVIWRPADRRLNCPTSSGLHNLHRPSHASVRGSVDIDPRVAHGSGPTARPSMGSRGRPVGLRSRTCLSQRCAWLATARRWEHGSMRSRDLMPARWSQAPSFGGIRSSTAIMTVCLMRSRSCRIQHSMPTGTVCWTNALRSFRRTSIRMGA